MRTPSHEHAHPHKSPAESISYIAAHANLRLTMTAWCTVTKMHCSGGE